ncbi:MAG: lipocalin family protein [Pyrinomonadaceae bacterium]|nr:lipocalin family protein [Pyrinomonadaceae bacterium]
MVAAIAAKAYADTDDKASLQTVSTVDLKRYMGKWYEIARLPNRFQKKCAGDVTATYSLGDKGKVTVLNQCRDHSGKLTSAKGKAKVADKKTNAKLKVTFVKSFFFWPFGADYKIIDLGADYEYAVVASGRDYLWILSRTPQMDEEVYKRLANRAAAQGFDVSRLQKTQQSSAGNL